MSAGWVEECSGNLETAEKYYCYALQLDPIDPMYFLRLLQLVQVLYVVSRT